MRFLPENNLAPKKPGVMRVMTIPRRKLRPQESPGEKVERSPLPPRKYSAPKTREREKAQSPKTGGRNKVPQERNANLTR